MRSPDSSWRSNVVAAVEATLAGHPKDSASFATCS
jgi:hypothetical protein